MKTFTGKYSSYGNGLHFTMPAIHGGSMSSGNAWPLRKYSTEKTMKTIVEISRIQNASIAIEYAMKNWITAASAVLSPNHSHVIPCAGSVM